MAFEIVAGSSGHRNENTVIANILDITKADFFQLNLPRIYGKVG